MLRTLLSLGLTLTIGSGALGFDYRQQALQVAQSSGGMLALGEYFASLQTRSVNLMEKEVGPRIAKLPQIAQGMTAFTASDDRTNEEQIDDFAKDSPQLQALLKADRAAAKEGFWARIRQKVVGQDQGQEYKPRLSAIRERNFPTPGPTVDPSELAGQDAISLYANRAKIQQGMSNLALQNMNAATAGMDF
ncbi:MAG: hypothetical protein AB8B60_12515 [Sulfitobacter sp.]